MTCVPSIRNLSTSRKKRMVLFHGGICVLCRRMYVLSLTWNFISCRNSECSPFLEWPFFSKLIELEQDILSRDFPLPRKSNTPLWKLYSLASDPLLPPSKRRGCWGGEGSSGWGKERQRARQKAEKMQVLRQQLTGHAGLKLTVLEFSLDEKGAASACGLLRNFSNVLLLSDACLRSSSTPHQRQRWSTKIKWWLRESHTFAKGTSPVHKPACNRTWCEKTTLELPRIGQAFCVFSASWSWWFLSGFFLPLFFLI